MAILDIRHNIFFLFKPTYRISAQQDAGGQYVVLVVFLKVVTDDQRRRHVDQTRSEAVHEAVRQEQPFRCLHERRAETTDREDAGAEEATDAEASMTEHSNEAD